LAKKNLLENIFWPVLSDVFDIGASKAHYLQTGLLWESSQSNEIRAYIDPSTNQVKEERESLIVILIRKGPCQNTYNYVCWLNNHENHLGFW